MLRGPRPPPGSAGGSGSGSDHGGPLAPGRTREPPPAGACGYPLRSVTHRSIRSRGNDWQMMAAKRLPGEREAARAAVLAEANAVGLRGGRAGLRSRAVKVRSGTMPRMNRVSSDPMLKVRRPGSAELAARPLRRPGRGTAGWAPGRGATVRVAVTPAGPGPAGPISEAASPDKSGSVRFPRETDTRKITMKGPGSLQ